MGEKAMTYEQKYDRINRLVGKIDGIFTHHIRINKPLPTYEMDKLLRHMNQTLDSTEDAPVTESYEDKQK
jgi:uncharacterized protein Yka (UPF0111/DUF47 family)